MLSADRGWHCRSSRIRRRAASTVFAGLLLALAGVGSVRGTELPPRGEVRALVQALRADPELKTTQLTKVLRARSTAKKRQPAQTTAPWLIRLIRWTEDALRWLDATARWLIWLLGALTVAMVAVSVRRWVREQADPGQESLAPLPSHIGPLDVRPASLPDRIGPHARGLWQQGEQRAALSLLYRGALSRLIHVHSVPIRAAHTESECVRLAQGQLQPDRGAFFAQLVCAWQLAVYAGRLPETAGVLSLCDQFDRLLEPPAPAKAVP
ncbi:MAG TPA: DUF4129 domain-containing protein [Burkholderiaceae bacterium]|nr:DUF4129 domain-containing protein [Burkholderiaceae bacterium]